MIPLKLNLRNFLSYRENAPTLDFSGVHVACLCGDNGHGKSALLDAITWSLWGRARGQVQDDLVSYGADEARVELEFLARQIRYRVVRSRRKAGGRRRQGATDLQLQALDDAGNGAQVITGNSVRETQAKVEQLVGMDYETFINSAFLLQGRADEFTNKTPADRKAVLTSILGLEAYDRYQARARERAGEKRSEADRVAGGMAQIQAEIDHIGNPAEELADTNHRLADLNARLEARRNMAEELRERVGRLRRLEAQLDERRDLARQARRDLDQLEAGMAAARSRIEQHQTLLSQAEEIRAGSAQLAVARQKLTDLEASRQQYDALNQEHNRLSQTIGLEQARLEAEIDQLRRRVSTDLKPSAQGETELAAALQDAKGKLAGITEKESGLADLRGRLQNLAEGVGQAQSIAARYQGEGEQLNEKLHLLNNTGPNAAVCPLCQSPLSESGRRQLAGSYERDIQEKRELYRNNRAHLQELEREKAELETELPRREKAFAAESNGLRETAARLETRLQAAKSAAVELERAQSQLQTLAGRVAAGDFAEEERSRLAAMEELAATLDYDEDAYREAFQLTRELEPYTEMMIRLEQAAAQLPNDEAALEQAQVMLDRKIEETEAAARQIVEGEAAVAELPQLSNELAEEAEAVAELERLQQAALAQRGRLEGQVARLETLRGELERNRESQVVLQEEQGIFQELVNAFGRQGIQAMLIETVVPRLEEETNSLLGRMTDNRMHVKLETQRERRSGSGEPIETLEINVSDELGSRSYEMYSGGEAFRVNLALRIALSRVLSQRTGAPLPTLFIDEGFGTQDASGRERILDVISAIEDDFDKIIVITHLDDLKDMFPVRIEVQKDANGSTFWLS